MTSESDQLPALATSDQAGVGDGVGVASAGGSSGVGTAEAMGMGMKTAAGGGVPAVGVEAFHSKPLPIRSILLYAELVESEFTR